MGEGNDPEDPDDPNNRENNPNKDPMIKITAETT